MAVVCVVEARLDEVVDVVAMRNGLVTAGRAVRVQGVVAVAGVILAILGIERGERVLVDVIAMGAREMAVVKIVDLAVVLDRGMAATSTVNVRVVGMCTMFHGLRLVPGAVAVNAPFARSATGSRTVGYARAKSGSARLVALSGNNSPSTRAAKPIPPSSRTSAIQPVWRSGGFPKASSGVAPRNSAA